MNSLLEISTSGYLLASNLLKFVFCIFMVVYMRVAVENQNNSHSRYFFKCLISLVVVNLFADMASYAVDTNDFFAAEILSHLTMAVSVLTTVLIGYFCNRFFDVVFSISDTNGKRKRIYLTPFIAISVLLIFNLSTGILYSIDENNVYSRGDFAIVSFILQYAPFAVLAARAIFHKFPVKTIRYMKLRNGFIWLGILILVFGTLQVIFGGKIALQCLGITASIFIMFSRFQDDQITNDPLTGLNNRYALETYVEDRIKNYADGMHGRRQLYLVMMDVNYFKRINDIHGHVEGDKALKTVAATLKKIGAEYKSELFIARFGGDEFSAVFESESERRVNQLCLDIQENLRAETENSKYLLTVGTGFALYTGKTMAIDELYERADKALYENKEKIKNGEK